MKGDDYAGLARELIEIGIALTSVRDLDELLDLIVTEARRFTGCDAASLYITEKEQLRFALTQNETLCERLGEEAFRALFHTFFVPIDTDSVAGYVAATGEKVLIDDAYALSEGTPFTIDSTFDERNDYRTASMLVVPMTDRDGGVIGVLQLINCRDETGCVGPFDRDVAGLVEALASQAAIALKNAQLTAELRQVHFSTIVRLSVAAEFRDRDTANHIRRVSHYCELLSRQLGWSKEDGELIKYAGAMHDVGKIAIPDNVLLKPGTFTPAERTVMERHAGLGGDILGENPDARVLVMARVMAITHHERWDGRGYPKGLAGEEIPECGRICAVADVFDALGTKRPYKDALPMGEVLETIRHESGSHFDPDVVGAFFAILDEILEVRDRFSEVEA